MKVVLLLFAFIASLAPADPMLTLYDSTGHFTGSCFATGSHEIRTAAHCAIPGLKVIVNGNWVTLSIVSINRRVDVARLYCPVILKDRYRIGSTWPQSVTIRGAFPGAFESSYSSRVLYGQDISTDTCRIATAMSNAVVRGGYSGGPVVDDRSGRVVGILSCRSPFRGHGGFVHSSDW